MGLGLLLAAISSTLVPLLGAQDSSGGRPSEPKAVSQLKRASPSLAHFKTFLRRDVGAGRSLLVVAGSDRSLPDWREWPDFQSIPWFPGDAVGIFLASGSPAEAVWSIETLVSDGDWTLRIECVSSESITFLQTDGDYGIEQGAIKTVFDIDAQQAGQLLEFPTVGVRRFEGVDGQLYALLGPRSGTHWTSQQVARITGGMPELLNPEDSRSVLASLSGTSHNALDAHPVALERPPQSTQEALSRYRTLGSPGFEYEVREEFGPVQIVGDRLWFGKTFYDGEGNSGVGGFGYHSASGDRFVVVSPPQVREWSVSAILVEGNVTWVGLHRRPEGEEQPGGLLRYDWRSREARRFRMRSIIRQIVRWGGNLHLATDGGLY